MRKIVISSPKGGTGKSMVATVSAMVLGMRGVRVGLLDLSMVNPTQEFRSGVVAAGTSVPTLDELPPVSAWWLENTTGYRLLSAPRSVAERTAEAMTAWTLAAVGMAEAAGLEVLLLDLDGISNNELHRAMLALADDVVFVLDRTTFTEANAENTVSVLQSPHDVVRKGLPQVGPERCGFMYCHSRGGGGKPAEARLALMGKGRWLGQLSYSAALHSQGDAARLAYACPTDVLKEMDAVVAALLPGLPSRPTKRAEKARRGRTEDAPAGCVVDSGRMLRVFAGPAAPEQMSLDEFRVFAAVDGWKVGTVALLADVLGVADKAMKRTVKGMLARGLLEQKDPKNPMLSTRPARSDLDELRHLVRQLAAGDATAEQVTAAMTAVTTPAYGGSSPAWAFTHGVGSMRGIPLADRAVEALLAVAEQVTRSGLPRDVAQATADALDRAGIAVPPGLAELTSRGRAVPAAPPAPSPPPPPAAFPPPAARPVPASAPEAGPEVAVAAAPPAGPPTATNVPMAAIAARPAATTVGRVARPRVLLRAFADGEATVVGARRPGSVQVPFALAASHGARSAVGLEEAGVVSASTAHKAFRSDDQEIVVKDSSSFVLADGVCTDYDWMLHLCRAALDAAEAGEDAGMLLADAINELDQFRGECYPMGAGKEQPRRWRWVDEWPEGATARQQAEKTLAEALGLLASAWRSQRQTQPDLAGGARRLVDGLLRIERTVIPGWRTQALAAAAAVAAACGRRDVLDGVALRVTQLAQNEGWTVPKDLSEMLGWRD